MTTSPSTPNQPTASSSSTATPVTSPSSSANSPLGVPHAREKIAEVGEELLKKTPKRLKGITRKIILRTINRRIVARLASRASIGIPLIGFYFVQRVLRSDYEEVEKRHEDSTLRNGFRVLTTIDSVDLSAQLTAIGGMAMSLMFQPDDIIAMGLPDVLKYSDKVSLSAAFSSTIIGTFLEIQRSRLEDEHESAHPNHENGNSASAPDGNSSHSESTPTGSAP